MTIRVAVAVIFALAPTVGLGAQESSIPPPVTVVSLGGRCQGRTGLDGAWRMVYAALAAPGDPSLDPALAALQDSVEEVLHQDPHEVEARFLLASILGARSEVSSGRAKLEWAGAMEVEARRILEREPGHPGARHLMGRLHAAVRRMSGFKRFLARTLFGGDVLDGGSWETARAHLEAAELGDPCVPDHHFELARLYMELGMTGEAAREIRHTLQVSALREDWGHIGRKALALMAEDPEPQRPEGGD